MVVIRPILIWFQMVCDGDHFFPSGLIAMRREGKFWSVFRKRNLKRQGTFEVVVLEQREDKRDFFYHSFFPSFGVISQCRQGNTIQQWESGRWLHFPLRLFDTNCTSAVFSTDSRKQAPSDGGSKVTSERVTLAILATLLAAAVVALIGVCELKQLFRSESIESLWHEFHCLTLWLSTVNKSLESQPNQQKSHRWAAQYCV